MDDATRTGSLNGERWLDPSDPALFDNRASVRLTLRNVEGALADAERSIELDPAGARAWGNRGSAHMRLGETEVFDILPPTHMITSTLADCASVTLNVPKEWRT